MKIAILGANGFVGTRMVELWRDRYDLRPVVRSFASLARLSRFDLDCAVADARNEEALKRALEGCDIVVHAVAGNADVVAGTAAPAYRAADALGVRRLVYISSASVHGQDPAPGTDELSPLSDNQWSWYNNAKVHAERHLLDARSKGKTETVILRPGIVWGPRSRWVTDFVEALEKGRACVVDGARGVLNSIFVDNLIRAVELAATAGGVDRRAYIVQDSESVCWRDLYEPLCQAAGYSWSDVHDVSPYQPGPRRLVDRLERFRGSKTIQKVLPAVPRRVKRVGKAALYALPEPVTPNQFALPSSQPPGVPEEMSRLYACQWRLPDDRARESFAYDSPVTFNEGLRLTIDWMNWAGYPVSEATIAVP